MDETRKILITELQPDYELLDSGDGEKLERWGEYVVARPDPQALWAKSLPETEWKKADTYFERKGTAGKWVRSDDMPLRWQIGLLGHKFWVELTPFKHTGIFPEQIPNWQWTEAKVADALASGKQDVKVLNLFGYTGGASVAAAAAGAFVTHVDASKPSISRAKENAELSDIGNDRIRWMLDDAFKFVEREARRGARYDAIVMDPPVYGRGAKGELWKIEEKLLPLLKSCKKVLVKDPLFVILNGYASGYSSVAYENCLAGAMDSFKGNIESGELAIRESKSGRFLPAGIFARWFR